MDRARNALVLLLSFVAAATVLACGGRQHTLQPAPSPFPSAGELGQIAAESYAATPFDEASISVVERWDLTGTLPSAVAITPITPQSDADALLVASVPPSVMTTEAMRCAANEVGAYVQAHDALPTASLRQFIFNRCGSTAPSSVAWQGWVDFSGMEPTEVLASYRESIAAWLAELPPQSEAGLWIGFTEGRMDYVVTYAEPEADYDRIEMRGPAMVQVRGRARVDYDRIRAAVTQGPYGAARCERDAAVRSPNFAFVCPTLATDEVATIELSLWEPDRLLGDFIGRVVVLPSGGEGRVYNAPLVATDVTGFDAASIGSIVNAYRTEAELEPFRHLPAQSETASSVLPAYLAAISGERDECLLNDITLGLMAGWDVEEPVVEGSVSFRFGVGSSPSQAVAGAMQSPITRLNLMDPLTQGLAVGVWQEEGRWALALNPFVMFGDLNFADDAVALYDRLVRERAELGHATGVLSSRAAGAVESTFGGGTLTSMPSRSSQNRMLQQIAMQTQRPVYAWLTETSNIHDFVFDQSLLDPPHMNLVFAVYPLMPDNAAWTRYLIVAVYTE